MSSDNPFSEPQDSDRTMFIPAPGGRRAPPAVMRSEPSRPAPADTRPGFASLAEGPAEGPARIDTGGNPLLVAASSLLALLARLRNTSCPPDAGDLRARAVGELRRFEQKAREAGLDLEQLRPAHYALCASLDDVVLATPWGAQSDWGSRSLVSSFHEQVRSGEGFFSVLRQVMQSPASKLPVIELMYFCLSLGFKGQYRLSTNGPAELDRVREDLYGLIARHRAPPDPGLSPHWQGVHAEYRPRRAELPLWVAVVVALAILGAVFATLLFVLNDASDTLVARINAAPPLAMPAIARPAPAGVVAPVSPLPEIQAAGCEPLRAALGQFAGQVSIDCAGTAPVLRISGDGMFGSGSAAIAQPYLDALARIGELLKSRPGPVIVAGYTDSQPIRRSLRFPSNYALSNARAEAAVAEMSTTIGDASRLVPEGHGDADPIERNTAHQERNRRIEIILSQGD